MSITYKLAEVPEDYEDARELLRAEQIELHDHELSFPTVLAYEDEECVGLMSCYIQDDMVIAGPLTLRTDVRRPITALRLCEKFERELSRAGVTRYIIHAERGTILEEAIPRYTPNMECYHDDGTARFYIRKIGEFQNGRT